MAIRTIRKITSEDLKDEGIQMLMRQRSQPRSWYSVGAFEVGEAAKMCGLKPLPDMVRHRGHGEWHVHTSEGLMCARTDNMGRIWIGNRERKCLGCFFIEPSEWEKKLRYLEVLRSYLCQWDSQTCEEFGIPFDQALYDEAAKNFIDAAVALLPNMWDEKRPTVHSTFNKISTTFARWSAHQRIKDSLSN